MKHSLLPCLLVLAGTTCAFSNTLSVSPASFEVTVGQTFAVDIDVDNVSPDLYAFQFTLGFDPTVVAADSITEGALFADTNDSIFLPGTIDNAGGNTGLTADTLAGGPAVTGPGTLAVVGFTAIGPGTATFTFSNVQIYDSSLTNPLPVTLVPGTADVATSEPATVCLLGIALSLMIFAKARRSKRAVVVASFFKTQVKGGAQAFNF